MNPRRNGSTLPRPGRSAYGVATAVILLLIPVVVLAGGNGVRDFLNFGAGVLSLVALSCSVIWGLVATDRLFLNTRQRLVAQAVHRTTAVSSVAFLLLHITVKLALDHTVLIAALIPFSLGVSGTAGLIGFGSLAGLLMIFTAVTGALRSAFASPAPIAARWRAMHMLAYPAWCSALIHGLYAGRQAKPIFTILYSLCLVAVMAALALRAAPAPYKRKVADRVLALLGEGNGYSARVAREEQLTASRAALAENTMPGFAPRPRPAVRRRPLRAAAAHPGPRAVALPDPGGPRRGRGARFRGRLPGHVGNARREPRGGRADRALPDAGEHAAHGDVSARRRQQPVGQLAHPLAAAGRRGAPLRVRPARRHGIQHPRLRQFGHGRLRHE